ncbi:GNAT family N-acetyltransferase [Aspergillus stella-maris]|uniref:GNAT family N-acetyltransferase n=1 Tax=Aspergillus stella-maris TaxID=1810926 RepID=UPI003CCE26E7
MPPTITVGYWERLDPASNLLGRVFDEDPILRYMLCNLNDEDFLRYLQPYWRGLLRAALLNGGVISEADGWKSVAVILPPGRSVDSPWTIIPSAIGFLGTLWRIGISGCIRMLGDYSRPIHAAKKRVLGDQEHYYVFAIGTEAEHQGKGLASALMESYKEIAWANERPIWLEATTARSRDLYLSLGFEQAEEITIGEGKAATDGTMYHEGAGVTLWAMVWWPSTKRDLIV